MKKFIIVLISISLMLFFISCTRRVEHKVNVGLSSNLISTYIWYKHKIVLSKHDSVSRVEDLCEVKKEHIAWAKGISEEETKRLYLEERKTENYFKECEK
jgi:hypothetical protein